MAPDQPDLQYLLRIPTTSAAQSPPDRQIVGDAMQKMKPARWSCAAATEHVHLDALLVLSRCQQCASIHARLDHDGSLAAVDHRPVRREMPDLRPDASDTAIARSRIMITALSSTVT